MSARKRRGEAMLLAAGFNLPPIKETASPAPGSGSPPVTSAAARGLGSPRVSSPLKPAATEENFSEHLQLLCKVFDAMLSGRALLKRRSEKVTMQTLAGTVGSCTGRQFKVEYVQQIKHLYPQAFEWQYIRVPKDGDPTRLEFQLLMRFDGNRSTAMACNSPAGPADSETSGHSAANVPRFNDAAERQAFRERVGAYVEAAQKNGSDVAEVPMADLPDKDSNAMLISNSPTTSMQGMLGRVGSLPRAYSAASPTSGNSSVKALRGQLNESPTGKVAQSAFAAGAAAAGKGGITGGKRLKIDVEPSADEDGLDDPSATTPAAKRRRLRFPGSVEESLGGVAPMEPEGAGALLPTTPQSTRKQGGVPQTPTGGGAMGRPPLAPSNSLRSPLLQKMLSAESIQMLLKADSESLASPAVKVQQDRKHTASMLPVAFDLLRAIYGSTGPCVKPRDELVTLMCEKTTHRSGINYTEAQKMLLLLSQVAPEFVTLDEPTPQKRATASSSPARPVSLRPVMVRISRAIDANSLRKKLIAHAALVASEPPVAGTSTQGEDKSPAPTPSKHVRGGASTSARAQQTPTKHMHG